MQFVNGTGQLARLGPGQIYEGVSNDRIRTYYNAAGGNVTETRLNLSLISPPAAPFATSGDDRDKITFNLTFTGSCCLKPISVEYCFPNPLPATQADLYQGIIDAFSGYPSVGGMGSFVIDGTELVFTGYQPGFDVDFEVVADAAYVAASGTNTPAGAIGSDFACPGLAVVKDPTQTYPAADEHTEDAWGVGLVPTQDVGDAASTQKWVGVLLDDDCKEQPPTIGVWPDLSNCDSQCKPRPTCLRVMECGPVTVMLEESWDNTQGCTLYYRYAVDGDFNTLGAFSFTAGAGKGLVPVNYSVDGVNGQVAKVYFN